MTSPSLQKVMLAVIHPTGEVGSRFYRSVVNLLAWDHRHHARILNGGAHLDLASGAQITTARNSIVRTFLNTAGIDWLWIVDADMEFEPDTLDRLVASAHPTQRPIVGGLCFALMKGSEMEVVPTIYADGPDGLVRSVSYPLDTLTEVGATGAACLLVHRSVLVKMAEQRSADGRRIGDLKWPWFAETLFDGPNGQDAYSEDLTFCLRARVAGFPIYVDTSIKIGHQKPVVIDEASYFAQPRPTLPPTFVVIPAKDRHEMTAAVVASLDADHVLVCDNGSVPPLEIPGAEVVSTPDLSISQMWNLGLDTAAKRYDGPHNVAVLNNDLRVPPGFLDDLARGLRTARDHLIAYPNIHDLPADAIVPTSNPTTGLSMSGWAFMVRGEAGLRVDEQFRWWFGDNDLQLQAEKLGGKVVCVGGVTCEHLHPNESTQANPDLQQIAKEDEGRFWAKWGRYLSGRAA